MERAIVDAIGILSSVEVSMFGELHQWLVDPEDIVWFYTVDNTPARLHNAEAALDWIQEPLKDWRQSGAGKLCPVPLPFQKIGLVISHPANQAMYVIRAQPMSNGHCNVLVDLIRPDTRRCIGGHWGEIASDGSVVRTATIQMAGYDDIELYFHEDTNGVDMITARIISVSALQVAAITLGNSAHAAAKATPSPSNAKRIAKGKKPLYDWHTVLLEPLKPKQESQGGHHASPRPHDRRGHFKNYKSGKRVWFAACTVNKRKPGFIFKDYKTKEKTT